jgi:hypothetical protein
MIPGLKFDMLFGIMFSLFGSIRFAGKIQLEIYIWSPTTLFFLSGIMVLTPPFFAKIYERSQLILLLKKRRRNVGASSTIGEEYGTGTAFYTGDGTKLFDAKVLGRVLRSCRPMTCDVGSFYVFERSTGLVCISIIIDLTAYLLLSH